jgi:fructose/tagatose bisphosphate aldolase
MQGLRELLKQTEKNRVAIGHFNLADSVLLNAVFTSAHELKLPVLVGASEGECEFMGSSQIAALVIAAGINIIHINTELRVAWRRGLEEGLAQQPNEVVPYKVLPFVAESVKKVARARLRLFNGDV